MLSQGFCRRFSLPLGQLSGTFGRLGGFRDRRGIKLQAANAWKSQESAASEEETAATEAPKRKKTRPAQVQQREFHK